MVNLTSGLKNGIKTSRVTIPNIVSIMFMVNKQLGFTISRSRKIKFL